MVFLSNEDRLLAEPPQPQVGRVTGGVQPFQPGTQDRPVVRHYGNEHGGYPHEDDEERDLHLGLLILKHGFTSFVYLSSWSVTPCFWVGLFSVLAIVVVLFR